MSFTVFLGNLPTWVTADDIKQWLAAEDLVADAVKVIRNHETQESKGFAFVEAPTADEMQAIIRRFDRAPLEDRLLRANPAQPPKGKDARRTSAASAAGRNSQCEPHATTPRPQKTWRQGPGTDSPQRLRHRVGQGPLRRPVLPSGYCSPAHFRLYTCERKSLRATGIPLIPQVFIVGPRRARRLAMKAAWLGCLMSVRSALCWDTGLRVQRQHPLYGGKRAGFG